MGLVRSSLSDLLLVLAEAAAPQRLRFDDGSPVAVVPPPDAPVTVRASSLTRVGRSRHNGPVLDLELRVLVQCHGPQQLDLMERLLLAVELHGDYAVVSKGDMTRAEQSDVSSQGLGFLVCVPVSLGFDEPSEAPERLTSGPSSSTGRRIQGRLVDVHNKGIPDAYIHAHSSASAARSDATGHFEVPASMDELQHFAVAVDGTEREVSAIAGDLPVVIRWV
ncbi:hypothetical protein [Paenarthrobacter nitroguajacolicus]|uniref:hypothetical protein n=1 Tax=Paenarthrobacter nitroguajacolicus TaxID=211146 RepID=UPI002861D117|nr:hypothetical protein [Paenarthrobacter nitroguajacolicus]MDR6638903.1 hypothetical protein [Paenarthrobacter nitroguajacolicus]